MNKSYIVSTICIALLLLFVGVFGYFMLGARKAAFELTSDIKISLFLDDDITAQQRSVIEDSLKSNPLVEKFDYLSVEDATADFEKSTGITVKGILRDNPIPSSYEVDPLNVADVEQIEKCAASWAGVSSTLYPKAVSKELRQKGDAINTIILGVAVLLLIVSLSLIYYTLKLSVIAAAETIRTMQLVGVSPSFIKRPYVNRAAVQGMIAAFLSGGMFVLLIQLMDMAIPELAFEMNWAEIGMIFAVMLLAGIALNTLFTAIVLRIIVK